MFNISDDGIISLSRGDCFSTPLFINQGTDISPIRYELTDNDIVYLGVCQPNQSFENAIIKKVYDSDHREINDNKDLVISFVSTDTEYLESGLYYYTIKLYTKCNNDEELI